MLIVSIDTSGLCGAALASLETSEGVTLASARTLEEASASWATDEACVVVTGPTVAPDEVFAATSRWSADQEPVAVIMVTPEPSAELLRRALRAGVRDVLGVGEAEEALSESVSAAVTSLAPRVESGDRAPAGARVVSVFSTKGGVGKSVIATNLGVALAGPLKRSTAIVDLDLQFGDVAIMLQLAPERTIYEAVQVFDRLDAEMLRAYLTPHDSGLRALLAPVRPEDAEAVTVNRIGAIIELLRGMVDFVVLDTPATFDDVVLTAIDHSDDVYAVATMDVASIKNTRISMQKLRQLGYDDGLLHLVLNRADSKVWLDAAEVEKAIEGRIVAKIPSDRLVPRSVNKGVPVVLDAPRSVVAKSMLDLARSIADSKGVSGDVAQGTARAGVGA